MTEQTLPCSIEVSDADVARAENILGAIDNYIVRYLRHLPTVGLAKLPHRNMDGAIIKDAPPKIKRVICAGVPYACMIAFMYQEKLLIGWSKRLDARRMVDSHELRDLFRRTVNNGSVMYGAKAFDIFTAELVNFMSSKTIKDVEVPFSKAEGKKSAVIRGLNDSITVKGKYLESQASGPIPGELVKSLPQFIKYAEQIYGGRAANVGIADQELVKKSANAVAVV